MRGTFANIRIRNEMLDGVEGGYTKGPDGSQMSIYDAAMAYKEAGTPLVVIGGEQYSNLVGMGVIPFEFTGGDTRQSLGLTGDETFSINGLEGDLKPLSNVPCTITYADGSTKEIEIKCRIDTAIEIEYIEHGGVLHYVLRNLAQAA